MSETEGPESEVGCGVGDTAEAVLDRVDRLTHHHLTKVKRLGEDKRETVLY